MAKSERQQEIEMVATLGWSGCAAGLTLSETRDIVGEVMQMCEETELPPQEIVSKVLEKILVYRGK